MDFLVSLCNQFSSPFWTLGHLDTVGQTLRLLELKTNNAPDGTLGLAFSQHHLFLAEQGARGIVQVLDDAWRHVGNIEVPEGGDVHSLAFDKRLQRLFVVDTGNDRVLSVRLDGNGSPNEPFRDELRLSNWLGDQNHLNGLCLDHRGLPVVCGFGTTPSQVASVPNAGILLDTDGNLYGRSLDQPHSVQTVDGEFWLLESKKRNLCRIAGDEVRRFNIAPVGYLRGLAFTEDSVVVGSSAQRSFSKSSGHDLERSNDRIYAPSIEVLSREDLSPRASYSLAGLGREIYEIVAIPQRFLPIRLRTVTVEERSEVLDLQLQRHLLLKRPSDDLHDSVVHTASIARRNLRRYLRRRRDHLLTLRGRWTGRR